MKTRKKKPRRQRISSIYNLKTIGLETLLMVLKKRGDVSLAFDHNTGIWYSYIQIDEWWSEGEHKNPVTSLVAAIHGYEAYAFAEKW